MKVAAKIALGAAGYCICAISAYGMMVADWDQHTRIELQKYPDIPGFVCRTGGTGGPSVEALKVWFAVTPPGWAAAVIIDLIDQSGWELTPHSCDGIKPSSAT